MKRFLPLLFLLLLTLSSQAQRFLYSVNNFQELVALPVLPHTNIWVNWGYAQLDDLGGIFSYYSSSVTATNTTNCFKPLTRDGRYLKMLPQFFSGGGSAFADPSAKVGPVMVPGSATTGIRSDGAPAIDLEADYPWNGQHTFLTNGIFFGPTSEAWWGSQLDDGTIIVSHRDVVTGEYNYNAIYLAVEETTKLSEIDLAQTKDYSQGRWALATGDAFKILVTDALGARITLEDASAEVFEIEPDGNLGEIRNVTYAWPASQGAASTFLQNNGAGVLSWATVSGGTTINPTDSYLPYRQNATTFGDSSISHPGLYGPNDLAIDNDIGGHFIEIDTTSGYFYSGNLLGANNFGSGLFSAYTGSSGLGTNDPVFTGDQGIALFSTAGATAGLVQNSPGVAWQGFGWSTNAAMSLPVVFGSWVEPLNGADLPSGNLLIKSAISNSVLTTVFSVNSTSGYSGAGTLFLSDDGTYKATGGTTINPTDNYIPYRINATSFGDSPAQRVDASTIQIDGATSGIRFGSATNYLFRTEGALVYTNQAASMHFVGSTARGSIGTGTGALTLLSSNVALILGNELKTIAISGAEILPQSGDMTLGGPGVTFLAVHTTNAFVQNRLYWNGPTNTVFDTAGFGTPEGVVTADSGSTYRRYDGGAATSFYVKETDGVNTGWVAK